MTIEHTAVPPAANAAPGRQPGNLQAVILLCVAGLAALVIAMHGPSLPMMQQHFADVRGVDYLVPLALTVPMLVTTVVAVLVGLWSDRIGRKALLVWSALAYGVFGIAPLYLDGLNAILVSRAALGAAVAVLMTVSTAMIGDYYSGARRERLMALQITVASVTAFLSNALGGAIAEQGWRAPYACYAVALPLAAAMALCLWEPVRRAAHAGADDHAPAHGSTAGHDPAVFHLPRMLGIWAITLLVGLLFLVAPVHYGYLMAAVGVVSPLHTGVALGINSLGVIAGTLWFGWVLGPRLSVALQLAVAALLTAVGFIAMAGATGFATLTIAGLVNGVGCGVLLAVMVTWNMRALPVAQRGVGVGAFQSSMFFGEFINPLVVVGLQAALGGERASAVLVLGWATAAGGVVALVVGLLGSRRRAPAFT